METSQMHPYMFKPQSDLKYACRQQNLEKKYEHEHKYKEKLHKVAYYRWRRVIKEEIY